MCPWACLLLCNQGRVALQLLPVIIMWAWHAYMHVYNSLALCLSFSPSLWVSVCLSVSPSQSVCLCLYDDYINMYAKKRQPLERCTYSDSRASCQWRVIAWSVGHRVKCGHRWPAVERTDATRLAGNTWYTPVMPFGWEHVIHTRNAVCLGTRDTHP